MMSLTPSGCFIQNVSKRSMSSLLSAENSLVPLQGNKLVINGTQLKHTRTGEGILVNKHKRLQ